MAFGYAVILFQLSILLSSIAALMKKPRVWYLGLVLGVVEHSILQMASGCFYDVIMGSLMIPQRDWLCSRVGRFEEPLNSIRFLGCFFI
jgi:hypothetical protein